MNIIYTYTKQKNNLKLEFYFLIKHIFKSASKDNKTTWKIKLKNTKWAFIKKTIFLIKQKLNITKLIAIKSRTFLNYSVSWEMCNCKSYKAAASNFLIWTHNYSWQGEHLKAGEMESKVGMYWTCLVCVWEKWRVRMLALFPSILLHQTPHP